MQLLEQRGDTTRLARERAHLALDACDRRPLRERVFEIGRTLSQFAGMDASEVGRALASRDLLGEQPPFACNRIDRLPVLRQRVPIDCSAVTAGEGERRRDEKEPPHAMMMRPVARLETGSDVEPLILEIEIAGDAKPDVVADHAGAPQVEHGRTLGVEQLTA